MSFSESATADRALRLLSSSRAALLTDLDGTISRTTSSPPEATVSWRCRRALESLSHRLALVAVVSGRSAAEARQIVGLDGSLVYVGNHGLDIWRGGANETLPGLEASGKEVSHAFPALFRLSESLPGVLWEDKGATVSIHYRLAPDPLSARSALLECIEASPHRGRWRVTEGKMVVEIRPDVSVDKGTSVIDLLQQYEICAAVYLGDDSTDVDAFRALRLWRQTANHDALCVGILSEETPQALRQEADCCVQGVREVERLLVNLARNLTSPRDPRTAGGNNLQAHDSVR